MSQSQYYNTVFRTKFDNYGDVVTLVPFGDIHRDTKNCAVDAWLRTCDTERKLIAEGHNRIYIGLGDYMDFLSDSERWNWTTMKKHETTDDAVRDMIEQKCLEFIDEIDFMKGRTIGLLEGNHYFDFPSGVTSTQFMCEKLGCKYLGGVATIKLFIEQLDEKAKNSVSVDILASHYGTGGTLMGSPLNSLERMMKVFSGDIYLQGHSHQRVAHKTAQPMYLNKFGKLRAREMVLCNPGSYLRGYIDGKESYAVKKVARPVAIGQVYIELKPKRSFSKEENDRYVEFRITY